MKGFRLFMFIVVGLVAGAILAAALPKGQSFNPRAMVLQRRGPLGQPSFPVAVSSPKPPVTKAAPWIVLGIGLVFVTIFRRNEALVKIGIILVPAGLSALLGINLS